MKKFLSFILCAVVVLCLLPSVNAASPKIVDEADLLSYSEEQLLEEKAQALVDQYQMDVVILTVWSLDGWSAQTYADNFFDSNGYGIGSDYSGVIFLLSMEYRDWAISTCGDAIYALTDYGIETLFESVKDDLGNDSYYSAFYDYLTNLEYYFKAYENGEPIDGWHDRDDDDYVIYDPDNSGGTVHYDRQPGAEDVVKMVLVSGVIALIAATVTLLIMRGSMNTFRQQSNASSYLSDGGFHLTRSNNVFLYQNVKRTRREVPTSSGSGFSSGRGGGSSIHRSSSGRSHGGRSGKF